MEAISIKIPVTLHRTRKNNPKNQSKGDRQNTAKGIPDLNCTIDL